MPPRKIAVTLVLFLGSFCLAAHAQKAPRVAVFFEPGFPFYNATPFTSPRAIAGSLKDIGLEADLLNAAALSDANRFNIATYDAVVVALGNNNTCLL
jgi:hypothetical protein